MQKCGAAFLTLDEKVVVVEILHACDDNECFLSADLRR